MTDEVKVSTGEPGPNDVVFECANCGHSLCIDRVASGFSVICPHCNTEQPVPGEQMEFESQDEVAATGDADSETQIEELRLRNEELENLIAVQQGRLEQISREVGLIQAAMDRIVGLLQDAQIEPGSEIGGS